ncbi:hypothetical protein MKW94_030162 [Papaver nudicaule]|uniref:Uncharacterized protein n=1 Tax=Papaver nudicaule TaxID=74823 RepID=A0AA41S511_PAPNU|nr:hypothetical protein [Papaver nudicaule]
MVLNDSSGDDQDNLLLFGEIHKRSQKERSNNLLQPISSDHDLLDYSISNPNSGSSNYPLYNRTHSAKRMELPMERATPLFPSLEMEMDSKFSVNLESKLNHQPKSPTEAAETNEQSSLLATPTNSSRTQPNGANPTSTYRAPPNLRTTTSSTSTRSSSASRGRPTCNNINTINPSTPKSSSIDRQQQSLRSTSTTKDRRSSASRGSRYNNNSTNNDSDPTKSSSIDQGQHPRSITDTGSSRSSSASKSRLNYNITKLSSSIDEDCRLGNQHHSYVKPKRQSVSPSMTRGRKSISIGSHQQPEINNEQEHGDASTTIMSSRGRIHRASGGNNNEPPHVNVFGSKMVDKVMNARRSSTLPSVAVVNQEREISHRHKARGFTSSSSMINNEVSGFRKPSSSSSPSSEAAQDQDRGTSYKPKFENSTSSFSSPISDKKPGAGRPKTSSHQALQNSKQTHNHFSIRRAIEQSRVCMNVEVIKLNTVTTGDKKDRRKFTAKGEN